MTSELEYIKNRLLNYEYEKKRIQEINDELEAIAIQLTGVHSPSLDAPIGGSGTKGKTDHFYDLMNQEAELIEQREFYQRSVDMIERILNELDQEERKAIENIYMKRKGYLRCSEEENWSIASYYRIVKKVREKLILLMKKEH